MALLAPIAPAAGAVALLGVPPAEVSATKQAGDAVRVFGMQVPAQLGQGGVRVPAYRARQGIRHDARLSPDGGADHTCAFGELLPRIPTRP